MITQALLDKIRVLWRHPRNGWLYGVSYDMRADVGQSPTDLRRAPARRDVVWSFAHGRAFLEQAFIGERTPVDWLVLDMREPAVCRWLRKIEERDGVGTVPEFGYEWARIEAPLSFEADGVAFGWTDTIGGE